LHEQIKLILLFTFEMARWRFVHVVVGGNGLVVSKGVVGLLKLLIYQRLSALAIRIVGGHNKVFK